MSEQAKTGDKWRPVGGNMTWSIAAVSPGKVHLTGPGPCRGMKSVVKEEFYAEWEKVT